MSYNSKYSGQQVEALLDQVASGNAGGSGGGGGITTELDPIFSASPAAKITEENIEEWNGKLDATTAASTYAKKEDMPTNVSELVNDAKYASAEDTDDVVEEPEGGGSTGGSNIYTLYIGEWDGVSDINSLPMTAEVIEDLLSSDCVRIKYTSTDINVAGDVYIYMTTENKTVLRESGIIAYYGIGQNLSTGDIVYLGLRDSGEGITAMLMIGEQPIPYQPVFGIGMYDAENDSWTSLTDFMKIAIDVSEIIELNKTAYNRIKAIGYGGAMSGMINSLLVYRLYSYMFEPVSMIMNDSDETGFVFGFIINIVKNDGTISRWIITFDEDGIETYGKYVES